MLAAAALLAPGGGAWAQAPLQGGANVRLQDGGGVHAGEFTVPINKSQILRLDVPFRDVSVGNSRIADVLALSDRTIYVLGKAIGSTSLTIFGPNRQLIAVADVNVTHDVQGLKARLFELMPQEKIEIRPAGGNLILAGQVSTGDVAQNAVTVAKTFAGDKVTNMMRVRERQQVMLAIRFAEVQRTALKAIGVNLSAALQNGTNIIARTGVSSRTTLPSTAGRISPSVGIVSGASAIAGAGTIAGVALAAVFDGLENTGALKTLAEPNLIALSGDTANFLAGGEFPYRVVNRNGDIGIEFKNFGVSLSFTPTVLDSSRINLVVAPEVSSIDTSVEVDAGAALRVSRASTTVELGDGESFAIAGLLQNDFDDTINRVPGFGDVPILGALFRSAQYNKKQTELVILVTPRLVKPTSPSAALVPSDKFIPPTDAELFFMGREEGTPSAAPTPDSAPGKTPGAALGAGNATPAAAAGGLSGARGHIIE